MVTGAASDNGQSRRRPLLLIASSIAITVIAVTGTNIAPFALAVAQDTNTTTNTTTARPSIRKVSDKPAWTKSPNKTKEILNNKYLVSAANFTVVSYPFRTINSVVRTVQLTVRAPDPVSLKDKRRIYQKVLASGNKTLVEETTATLYNPNAQNLKKSNAPPELAAVRIMRLPTPCNLYQYDGTPITAPETDVTDGEFRVLFSPPKVAGNNNNDENARLLDEKYPVGSACNFTFAAVGQTPPPQLPPAGQAQPQPLTPISNVASIRMTRTLPGAVQAFESRIIHRIMHDSYRSIELYASSMNPRSNNLTFTIVRPPSLGLLYDVPETTFTQLVNQKPLPLAYPKRFMPTPPRAPKHHTEQYKKNKQNNIDIDDTFDEDQLRARTNDDASPYYNYDATSVGARESELGGKTALDVEPVAPTQIYSGPRDRLVLLYKLRTAVVSNLRQLVRERLERRERMKYRKTHPSTLTPTTRAPSSYRHMQRRAVVAHHHDRRPKPKQRGGDNLNPPVAAAARTFDALSLAGEAKADGEAVEHENGHYEEGDETEYNDNENEDENDDIVFEARLDDDAHDEDEDDTEDHHDIDDALNHQQEQQHLNSSIMSHKISRLWNRQGRKSPANKQAEERQASLNKWARPMTTYAPRQTWGRSYKDSARRSIAIDSFSYIVSDGFAISKPATVTIFLMANTQPHCGHTVVPHVFPGRLVDNIILNYTVPTGRLPDRIELVKAPGPRLAMGDLMYSPRSPLFADRQLPQEGRLHPPNAARSSLRRLVDDDVAVDPVRSPPYAYSYRGSSSSSTASINRRAPRPISLRQGDFFTDRDQRLSYRVNKDGAEMLQDVLEANSFTASALHANKTGMDEWHKYMFRALDDATRSVVQEYAYRVVAQTGESCTGLLTLNVQPHEFYRPPNYDAFQAARASGSVKDSRAGLIPWGKNTGEMPDGEFVRTESVRLNTYSILPFWGLSNRSLIGYGGNEGEVTRIRIKSLPPLGRLYQLRPAIAPDPRVERTLFSKLLTLRQKEKINKDSLTASEKERKEWLEKKLLPFTPSSMSVSQQQSMTYCSLHSCADFIGRRIYRGAVIEPTSFAPFSPELTEAADLDAPLQKGFYYLYKAPQTLPKFWDQMTSFEYKFIGNTRKKQSSLLPAPDSNSSKVEFEALVNQQVQIFFRRPQLRVIEVLYTQQDVRQWNGAFNRQDMSQIRLQLGIPHDQVVSVKKPDMMRRHGEVLPFRLFQYALDGSRVVLGPPLAMSEAVGTGRVSNWVQDPLNRLLLVPTAGSRRTYFQFVARLYNITQNPPPKAMAIPIAHDDNKSSRSSAIGTIPSEAFTAVFNTSNMTYDERIRAVRDDTPFEDVRIFVRRVNSVPTWYPLLETEINVLVDENRRLEISASDTDDDLLSFILIEAPTRGILLYEESRTGLTSTVQLHTGSRMRIPRGSVYRSEVNLFYRSHGVVTVPTYVGSGNTSTASPAAAAFTFPQDDNFTIVADDGSGDLSKPLTVRVHIIGDATLRRSRTIDHVATAASAASPVQLGIILAALTVLIIVLTLFFASRIDRRALRALCSRAGRGSSQPYRKVQQHDQADEDEAMPSVPGANAAENQ